MNVYGLDLSSTCTGICLPDGDTDHCQPTGGLAGRAVATKNWLRDCLAPGAGLFVIEAIGTRHVQTAIALAYVHSQVDELLSNHGIPFIKVAPTSLKRYAVGSGNAKKLELVFSAQNHGWDAHGDSTDDEADAWWLRAIGCHLEAEPVVPVTGYRLDIIERLRDEVAA